ncbi:hypothetical protein FACS189456_1780 [Bacteroidia bacterium]|nr:hypothetical protein FACS189456_1780 [Bacteroidia bacterium]
MKTKNVFLGLAATLLCGAAIAQSIPNGNFENGTTGWTIVNGTQTNQWVIGNAAGVDPTGSRAAYISDDGGSTYHYTNTISNWVYLYSNTNIPAGQNYELTFSWKAWGESQTNDWDNIKVYLMDPASPPTAGGSYGGELKRLCSLTDAWYQETVIIPAAATARLLVFCWHNDGSNGGQPPAAIDNVALTTASLINNLSVNLTTAGTLKDVTNILRVKNLTVTGNIDARDIAFMRDNMAVLQTVNMSGAAVQAYTGTEGTYQGSYGYQANEIPLYSFYNPWTGISKTSLTSATLPNGTTRIGSQAFQNCTGLTGTLTLPSNLQYIESGAFWNCTGFTGNLTIPSGVISIGGSAFSNCYGLTGTLTLPSNLQYIDNGAFFNCTGFTGNLTIPSGVISIGSEAFYNCTGLSGTLTLPSNLQYIENGAFQNCTGLTGNLTIPSGVIRIGSRAFQECRELTSVTFPSGITRIETDAFKWCYGLTGTLTLPPNLTHIGNDAFRETGFTGTLTLPSTLTTLQFNAFYGCTGFTGDLIIPDGVTTIGNQAFYNCTGFNGTLTLPADLVSIENSAFNNCSGFSGTLTIPNKVTAIGQYAFAECQNLTEIVVSNSVQTIGNFAFDNNCRVQTLTLGSGITSIGDYAFRNIGTCSGGSSGSVTNFNPTPLAINSTVFDGIPLSWVTLDVPNGTSGDYSLAPVWQNFSPITQGGYAITAQPNNPLFGSVGGLAQRFYALNEEITLVAAPTAGLDFLGWEYNGDIVSNGSPYVFTVTGNLKLTAKFGKVVTVISTAGGLTAEIRAGGDDPAAISKLVVTGDIDARDVRAIRDSMPMLEALDLSGANVVYYNGSEGTRYPYWDTYQSNEMPQYSFYNDYTGTGRTAPLTIVLPNSITKVGNYAFQNGSGLTSVTIPEGVTEIGYQAFYNCTGLTSINLPNSINILRSYAFAECQGLTGILTLPSNLTTMEDRVFQSNSGLASVIIPNSVTTIGYGAFMYCNNLTAINIPEGVTSLSTYTFYNCTNLQEVTIGSNVTTIGSNVFYYCNNLQTINNLSPTPVNISGNNLFSGGVSGITLNVPGSACVAYNAEPVWNSMNIVCTKYSVIATVYDATQGLATGSGMFDSGDPVGLVAQSLPGYKFDGWWTPDGSTQVGSSWVLSYTAEARDTTFVAHFAAASTDASLSGITLSAGSLDPVFSTTTYEYTVEVANAVTDITVNDVPTDGGATVEYYKVENDIDVLYSNPLPLVVGRNEIKVVVTAEDGHATQTYTLVVRRDDGISRDATLSALSLVTQSNDPLDLTPTFNDNVYEYTITVGYDTTGIKIVDTTRNYLNATVTIQTTNTPTSDGYDLNTGVNTFKVLVRAENPLYQQVYTINVERLKRPQTITWTQDFSAITNYIGNDTVLDAVASLPVTYNVRNYYYYPYNVATMSATGDTLRLLGEGWVIVTAYQAGNDEYAADSVSMPQFYVSKRDQNINWSSQTLPTTGAYVGDAAITLTAISKDFQTGAATGLSITYTSDNTNVATITGGNTLNLVGAGTANIYAEEATGSNVYNYYPGILSQTITLIRHDQTLAWTQTLPATAKVDTTITLTAAASSGLGVTYTSNNTAVATISGNRLTIVGDGTATITASQSGNAMYNPAPGAIAKNITGVVPADDARLFSIAVSKGTLQPAFAPATYAYTVNVANRDSVIAITGTVRHATATVVGDEAAKALAVGNNVVTLTVTAADGSTTQNYVVTVHRADLFTVTFDENGGGSTTAPRVVEEGGKVTAPANPTRTGYTFGGWYAEAACTTAWNFASDVVIANTTLYAKWTQNTYTVAFNTQGGSAAASLTGVAHGSTISAPATDPTRTGYVFDAWYKDAASTTAWDFASDVIAANTTLYAKWTPTYSVSFNTQGGSTVDGVGGLLSGATISKPATDPTRTGYKFDGWYKEAAGTTAWDFASDVVTANTTLYAKWTRTYTVTFDPQGGSAVAALSGIVSGSTIAQPADPTREGYVLDGWYKESYYSTEWNFATDKVTANTTLYAKWSSETEAPTGIATQTVAALKVYPNPVTTGELIIANESSDEGKINVYNIGGGLVGVYNVSDGGSTTINIAHLPAGTYIVKVAGRTAKVVKQ